MEDKKTAIAVLLCMFVLMFWMEMVMSPYRGSQQSQQAPLNNQAAQGNQVAQTNSATNGQQNIQIQPITPVSTTAQRVPPTPAQIKEAGTIKVQSPIYEAEVSKLGGRMASFLLAGHKAHMGSDSQLDMILVSEKEMLPLGVQIGSINDDSVTYTVEKVEGHAVLKDGKYVLENGASLTLHLTGNLNSSAKISKILTFNADSYLIHLAIKFSSVVENGSSVWLEWTHYNSHLNSNNKLNHDYFAMLGPDNKVKLTELKDMPAPHMEVGPQQWISYGDRYFMATLIPPQPGTISSIGHNGAGYYSRVSAQQQAADFNIFIGPKSHEALSQAGFQLERNVDLGMFTFIARPLLAALNFFYALLGNYGLAIILLTLVIKCAFLPLTKTSFESMKAMQNLQPEMKALRERIQDPTKLNQEMMALYKKHGVNPMGGCLPMLIQLPVFLGLYNALNNSIELRHAPFALWINDLSSVERLEVFGIGIPVMVLLMGASMFIQQLTTPSAADPQQKKIMLMMPIIFTISFVIFPFPSGLVLYWLVNNLISIIQQMSLVGTKKRSAFQSTILASMVIFFCGYLLTLI